MTVVSAHDTYQSAFGEQFDSLSDMVSSASRPAGHVTNGS